MTSLIPIAPLELDPRNQGQIVEAAATQIYTASGGLINDFSAGSPALCLIEGQAFTNAEFLYWLNKLPNAFLATWLQHYCGIQRKTNGFATAQLIFTLSQPLARPFTVFQGYRVRVPSSINQANISFVTTQELVIPAGILTGAVLARAEDAGTVANVGANLITQPESNLAFLQSVTNPSAASGGMDAETVSDTVSRAFFHTLSYRNPVSEADWIGLIKARLGLDIEVIVKVDREAFIYYFYLLKNLALSPLQLENTRQFLKQKAVLGYDIVVENFKNQYVDLYLEVSDRNNVTNGVDILDFLKDDVFLINSRFSSQDSIQGLDIASFFAEKFSYLDPNLDRIEVYSTNTNPVIAPINTSSRPFKYLVNDLIWDGVNYYRVLSDFNSIGANFLDYVSDPVFVTDFKLAQNGFTIGQKNGGDIVFDSGNYYLVPNNGYYNSLSNLVLLTVGNFVAGNVLNQGQVYVDSGISPLYCYIPRFNITTQNNLTSLPLCQSSNKVSLAPVTIPVGTPFTNSGYLMSGNTLYFNLDPATVHPVTDLSKGHKYKSRYRAGQVVLEKGEYRYIYRDHSPNINMEREAKYYIQTAPVSQPTIEPFENFVIDTDGVTYLVNVSNSDDTLLVDKELLGLYTRDNVSYSSDRKVIKEGVEYGYKLRRAVVKHNGVISQSLSGVQLPSTKYIDYKNRC